MTFPIPDAYIDYTWLLLLVAITTEELVWVLKAKAGDFIAGLKGAERAQDGAGRSTKKYMRILRAFSALLIGGVVAALTAVATALVKASAGMAANAARQRQLSQAFHNLARSASENGNKILRAMREGLGGAASQMDILLEANKALVSGLPASAEKMGELTRVARGMARIMGIDVTEALQRMVRGISKQEIELLDELFGGSIRFQDILKTLPSTASAAERQMAIYNEVLRVGAQRVKEAGLESTGFDTTVGKMKANVNALWIAIGTRMIPVFEEWAEKISTVAENLEELITDRTVHRLRELGQDDLADAAQAQVTARDLEAQRSRASREANTARLALARMRATDAPGGFRNRATARRATADVAGALTLENERAALERLTKAEIGAIEKRVAAQRALAEVSDGNARRITAAERAARNVLNVAREQEGALRKERDAVLAVIEALEKQREIEAQILKARQEAANIGHALPELEVTATRPRTPTDTTDIENILNRTAPLIESDRRQRSALGIRGGVLREKVEIDTDVDGDKLERDLTDAATRAAKRSQDAMTKFTDEVPTRFERNMHDAFDAVQQMADGFGLRTHGILSGAFNVVSGGARLSQRLSGVGALGDIAPTLGKMSKTLESVAGALGPVGGVIGGAIGVFKGFQSLFDANKAVGARAAGQIAIVGEITDRDQLQAQIDTIKTSIQPVLDAIERGETVSGATAQWLAGQQALLTQLEDRLAELPNPEAEGNVTYTTTITITDATAKNLIESMSTNNTALTTNSTRLNTLSERVKTLNDKIVQAGTWSPESITMDESTRTLIQSLLDAGILTESQKAVLDRILRDGVLTQDEYDAFTRISDLGVLTDAQKSVLDRILRDGVLTQAEYNALKKIGELGVMTDAQKSVLDGLLADGVLTQDEYDALKKIGELGVMTDAQKSVLDGLLADGVLTQDEYDALKKIGELGVMTDAQKSVLDGLLADGVLTQDEYDALKKIGELGVLTDAQKSVLDGLLADGVLTEDEYDALKKIGELGVLTDAQKSVLDGLLADGVLTEDEYDALKKIGELGVMTDAQKSVLDGLLADGVLTEDEYDALKKIGELGVMTDAQKSVLDGLLADGVLTEDEYDALKKIGELGVLTDAQKSVLDGLLADGVLTEDELSAFQKLVNGEVPPIEIEDPPIIPLQMPSQEEIASVFGAAISKAIEQALARAQGRPGLPGTPGGYGAGGAGKTGDPLRTANSRGVRY